MNDEFQEAHRAIFAFKAITLAESIDAKMCTAVISGDKAKICYYESLLERVSQVTRQRAARISKPWQGLRC